MYNFDFSYKDYQLFLERCPFSDEEKEIIALKRKGKSNTQICMNLGISSSALSTRIRKIAKKIAKEIQ